MKHKAQVKALLAAARQSEATAIDAINANQLDAAKAATAVAHDYTQLAQKILASEAVLDELAAAGAEILARATTPTV